MLNVNKIKGRIIEIGTNQTIIANQLKMNPATFNRKINREDGFYLSIKEAQELCKILKIDTDDIVAYFFAE